MVPFGIFVAVLVAARPSRVLREFTVALVGLYPAVLYRMTSPLVLGGFDEHQHERTLLDLLHGSGLFAPNPMLPISPHYPGLELFTGVGVRLTGVPVVLAMILVVLLCRLILVLAIYHSALTVSPSNRGASLVVIFYAVSPQFYFFNSQFAYQTLALTLGMGGIFLLRRAQLAEGAVAGRLTLLGILALVATVVTHHLTSWLVLAFLIAWTLVTPRGQRKVLTRTLAVMGICVLTWTAVNADMLVGYLGPLFSEALQGFKALVGGAGSRQLLSNSAGPTVTPEWQKAALVLYAAFCTGAAVTCGLILLSRALRNRDRKLGLLGLLTLAYPSTLAAHLVTDAVSMGDRASTFLFLPLALSCSLVIMRDPRLTRRAARRPGRVAYVSFASMMAIIYMSAILLGAGPEWSFLPGRYLVSADSRTQDPETLAAVRWAATHLPPGSAVTADRVPSSLMASQTQLWPVTVPAHGLEPISLYFSSPWGPYQTATVRGLHIRYIYVDQRLATSLPYLGFYFYPGETPQPQRMSVADLTKFAYVPGLKAVYHHGPITIYDTSGLGVTGESEGFVGERSMGLGTVGDAVWGAVMAALILALRRRLAWVVSAAREAGAVATGIAGMAITILVGGLFFGLRIMPGPSFTVGAVLTAVIFLAIERADLRLVPRIRLARRQDFLVALGILACLAGLAIGLHAAWASDVSAVDAILRQVAAAKGK